MFAIGAVIAFALALILHIAGHGVTGLVTDFVLGGLLLVALHLAFAVAVPLVRRQQ